MHTRVNLPKMLSYTSRFHHNRVLKTADIPKQNISIDSGFRRIYKPDYPCFKNTDICAILTLYPMYHAWVVTIFLLRRELLWLSAITRRFVFLFFFASFTLLQDFLVFAVKFSPICAQKVANVANALAKKVLDTSESSACTSAANKNIAAVVCEFQSRLLTSFAIQIPGVSRDLDSLEWSDIPLILTSGEIRGDGTINSPTSKGHNRYHHSSYSFLLTSHSPLPPPKASPSRSSW